MPDPILAYLQNLHQQLKQHFSEEDLRTLCFNLGIEYDDLGARGREANARELIKRLNRIGRLPDLIQQCRLLRSNVTWADPLSDTVRCTGNDSRSAANLG